MGETVTRRTKWSKAVEYYAQLRSTHRLWVFRGHREHDWQLESTLERACQRWFGKLPTDAADIEKGLVRRLQRYAHLHVSNLPVPDAELEWLAMMQHHYAPTRLLDWTYSFYVACFFALDNARSGKAAYVWAVPYELLAESARTQMGQKAKTAIKDDGGAKKNETVRRILEDTNAYVYPMNPLRHNQRMSVKQGTFLVPANITQSFAQNLKSSGLGLSELHRVVLNFDKDEIKKSLLELRGMNVTHTSLFPGLDGFMRDMGVYGFDWPYRANDEPLAAREAKIQAYGI